MDSLPRGNLTTAFEEADAEVESQGLAGGTDGRGGRRRGPGRVDCVGVAMCHLEV
jgi:hypothetical protein